MAKVDAAFYHGDPCKNGHTGLRYVSTRRCVDCIRARSKLPSERAGQARYRSRPENRELARARTAQWRAANRDKHRANVAAWKAANQGEHNASCMKRYVERLKRTPLWAEHEWINHAYRVAAEMSAKMGEMYVVDHEIPLQGRVVSGLHVYENLQVIPAIENSRKGNKLTPAQRREIEGR